MLTIGLFYVGLSGIFCGTEDAAMSFVKYNDMGGCADFTITYPLMPQAVVAKTDKYKVVRLGTKTDPVENVWMVIPRAQKVIGEPVD